MDDTTIIGTTNKKGQVITDPRMMMNDAPRTPSFFTGSEVIKEAVRRANVDVMVAYPITPQSEAAALCGELFAEGYIGDYFRGESEFAVMSQCAGAAFGGARVFTTTAGPGTMRAMENFPMWAGARLPIQCIVTCRGINSPLSIQPDTIEIAYLMNTGMLVWHAETAQDFYDWIDVYQMHHVDREAPWEEIWQAMEQLVREGKVVYVGSSNFAGWHLAQAQEAARSRNFLGLVSEQSLYNLNERTIELEVIPACEAYGIGLIPWSPLGRGLLAGVLRSDNIGRRADADLKQEVVKSRLKLEAYEGLCARIGERPADVALAWLLHQRAVTSPIIGPRTMEQLEGAMRALSLSLGSDILKQLDELFPGPGGTAPESYAW